VGQFDAVEALHRDKGVHRHAWAGIWHGQFRAPRGRPIGTVGVALTVAHSLPTVPSLPQVGLGFVEVFVRGAQACIAVGVNLWPFLEFFLCESLREVSITGATVSHQAKGGWRTCDKVGSETGEIHGQTRGVVDLSMYGDVLCVCVKYMFNLMLLWRVCVCICVCVCVCVLCVCGGLTPMTVASEEPTSVWSLSILGGMVLGLSILDICTTPQISPNLNCILYNGIRCRQTSHTVMRRLSTL
jgi:hypothetical protein